jgi:hypothetical protein
VVEAENGTHPADPAWMILQSNSRRAVMPGSKSITSREVRSLEAGPREPIGDFATLRPEAPNGARLYMQRINLFQSFGAGRAPAGTSVRAMTATRAGERCFAVGPARLARSRYTSDLKRWFAAVDARPAVSRARAVGKDHPFKIEFDEEAQRALFPSNYPLPHGQRRA